MRAQQDAGVTAPHAARLSVAILDSLHCLMTITFDIVVSHHSI